jgi:pyruvate/2-oxoglutarate dehydrogenase complex dihydrolipoamide dehydrogenase (E3) component
MSNPKQANEYDLVVIGSGPARQKGAICAAKLRKKVAIIDRERTVGGVGVHTGTIPSKMFREAVLYLSGLRQRTFYGRGYVPHPSRMCFKLAEKRANMRGGGMVRFVL